MIFLVTLIKGFIALMISEVAGALFFWLLKNRKTKFVEELVHPGWRNSIVGWIIWILFTLFLLAFIINYSL